MKTGLFGVLSLLSVLAPGFSVQAETLLERGKYLMDAVVACGNCHTPQGQTGPVPGQEFAGQLVLEIDGVMTAWAPNITPDPEAGIGSWTDGQLVKAIREGVRPDGSVIAPIMPVELYRALSDRDAQALVAYLRQVRPIANAVPRSEFHIPLPPDYGPPLGPIEDVPASDPLAYGAYLVSIAHCMECHTPMTDKGIRDFDNRMGAGGFEIPGPWGVSVSSNITPHADGIAAYSDVEIKRMISTGIRPDGSRMAPPMAYAYYAKILPGDLDAIVAFLRQLPPKPSPN